MPTPAVSLLHIHGELLLGGKNLFQKAAHQFGRTVESIQIGFYVVPQVVVLVAPTNGLFLGGGKFFFQAAVLHIHHIAVVGLLFQLGKLFFGQRIVAEKGALTNIIQIARMNEGFFCERDLFLHSGKFLFGLGEGFVGLGEVLLFLVNLGGQSVQSLLLPLDFELGDGQVFFSAATLTALYIRIPGVAHIVEEIVLQDTVRLLQDWLAALLQDRLSGIVQQGLGSPLLASADLHDGLLDCADQCLVLAAFRPEDLLFHGT